MKTFAVLFASGPLLAAAAALAQNTNTQSAVAPAYSDISAPGTTQQDQEAAAQTTINDAAPSAYTTSNVNAGTYTTQGGEGPAPTTASSDVAATSDGDAGASGVTSGGQQSDVYPGTTTSNGVGQQTTCTDQDGNHLPTHEPVPVGPHGDGSFKAKEIDGIVYIPAFLCGHCAHPGKQDSWHHNSGTTSAWAPEAGHPHPTGQRTASGQSTGSTGGYGDGAGAQPTTTMTTGTAGQPTGNYGDGPGTTNSDGGAGSTGSQSGATTLQTTSVKPTTTNGAQPTDSYNDDGATGTTAGAGPTQSTTSMENVRVVLTANGDGTRDFAATTDNKLTIVPDGGLISSKMEVSAAEDADAATDTDTEGEPAQDITCTAFSDKEGTKKLGGDDGAVKMGESGDVTKDGPDGEEVKVMAVKCTKASDAEGEMVGIGDGQDSGDDEGDGPEN